MATNTNLMVFDCKAPKSSAGGRWPTVLLRHNMGQGERLAHHTDRPAVVIKDGRVEARKAFYAALKKRKGVKGKPQPVRCFMVSGPPSFGEANEWPETKLNAYFLAAHQWFEREFPTCPIAVSAQHMHETTPHMHYTIVPLAGDGQLGWTQVLAEWGERNGLPPIPAKPGHYVDTGKGNRKWVPPSKVKPNRDAMRKLRKKLYTDVAREFGLLPGKERIRRLRRDTPPDTVDALKEIARREAACQRREAEQTAREADQNASAAAIERYRTELSAANAALKKEREVVAAYKEYIDLGKPLPAWM